MNVLPASTIGSSPFAPPAPDRKLESPALEAPIDEHQGIGQSERVNTTTEHKEEFRNAALFINHINHTEEVIDAYTSQSEKDEDTEVSLYNPLGARVNASGLNVTNYLNEPVAAKLSQPNRIDLYV